MTVSNAQDPVKIQRALLTLFLVGASVFLAWFGLSRGMPLVGLAIPVVAVVSGLLGRPEFLLMTALFAVRAKMKIPGFPDTLGVYELFQGLIIGWAMLDVALRKRKSRDSYNGGMDLWLILFLINLFLIISVRGFGLARGGGTTWGGASYVTLFLSLLFFFSAVRIRIRPEQIRALLWVMLGGAIVPIVVELLVAYSGGAFFWLTEFFSTGAESLVMEGLSEEGISRFKGAGGLASVLIPLAFVLCRKKIYQMFWLLTALALISLSGFRSGMVSIAMLIFLLTVYDSKSRVKTILFWVFVGVAGLAFLMVAAPMLPRAVQRAVSFFEFIPVDPDIAQRAGGSSTWRFDMWRDYCLPHVPQYLLVGRGLAREISGFAWLQGSWYASGEFFYHMGRYHSGPFSLLLDYGLLGTVSFTTFFLLAIREGWTTLRRVNPQQVDRIVYRFYVYLVVRLTYGIASFFLIFGDVRESLPQLLITFVLMRIVRKNLLEPNLTEVGCQISDVSVGEPEGSSETTQDLPRKRINGRQDNVAPDFSPSQLIDK